MVYFSQNNLILHKLEDLFDPLPQFLNDQWPHSSHVKWVKDQKVSILSCLPESWRGKGASFHALDRRNSQFLCEHSSREGPEVKINPTMGPNHRDSFWHEFELSWSQSTIEITLKTGETVESTRPSQKFDETEQKSHFTRPTTKTKPNLMETA